MIENYAIGVSLTLTGETNEMIMKLAAQFEAIEQSVSRVRSSVASMAAGLGDAARQAEGAAAAWGRVAAAMEAVQRAGAGFGGRGWGGTGAGGAWGGGGGYRTPLEGPIYLPGPGGSGSGSGGGGDGGDGGDGPLLLTGPGAPDRLPKMPRTPSKSTSTQDLAMRALIYGAMADGIFSAGKDAFSDAAAVDQMKATLIGQGLSVAQTSAMAEAARNAARATPGIQISSAMKAAMDLRTVLGGTASDPASPALAIAALPAFITNAAIFKKMGDDAGDESFAGAKTAELLGDLQDEKTGGVSVAGIQKFLDASARAAIATNMRVAPHDFLSWVKQARVSGLNLGDDYLYKVLPTLMMETGGSRAGTGEMAAFRQFSGGTMTESKFVDLEKLGLIDKSAKWSHGRVGDMQHHLKDFAEFDSNPAEWVWNVLEPALTKAGIKGPKDQAQYLGNLMTNTGAGYFGALIAQEIAIKKDMHNIGAANTGPAALDILNQGAESRVGNFQTSFHNLLTDLGGPLIPPATTALDLLRKAMDQLGQEAHDHPGIAAWVDFQAAGVAAALAAKASISLAKFTARVLGMGGKTAGAGAADASAEAILTDAATAGRVSLLGPLGVLLAGIFHSSPANEGEAAALKKWRQDNGFAEPGSSPQNPTYTRIINAADIAHATTTGLGGVLSAAPNAPTGPTTQYTPRAPGH